MYGGAFISAPCRADARPGGHPPRRAPGAETKALTPAPASAIRDPPTHRPATPPPSNRRTRARRGQSTRQILPWVADHKADHGEQREQAKSAFKGLGPGEAQSGEAGWNEEVPSLYVPRKLLHKITRCRARQGSREKTQFQRDKDATTLFSQPAETKHTPLDDNTCRGKY